MSKLPAHLSASTLPAFMQGAAPLGNENVSAEDLQIPRLKVLQQLSPELDDSKAAYVEGARAGDILNTVTKEVAKELTVANLYYEKKYNLWLKRELGGGLVSSFNTEADAFKFIDDSGLEAKNHDLVETATHYVVILNDEGKIVGQAAIDMISSGLSVSAKWNTNISMIDAPRFGSVWALSSTKRSNTKGSWYVFDIAFKGFLADEATFNELKRMYEGLAAKAA